jgi:lysophospholipase L1-like esterase
MKRALGCLINLALVAVSLLGTVYLATLADGLVGAITRRQFEPGKMGMLFVPNLTESFDMHDFKTVESTNSLGLREREFPLAKSDKLRVVAIGDSFTYGWGVNLEDTWCKQLEKRLLDDGLDVEVINLGKPAAGPFDYAWIAETLLPLLQPDLVLVGVLVGDDLQQAWVETDLRSIARGWFPNSLRYFQMLRTEPQTFGPSKNPVEETRRKAVATAEQLLREMTDDQRKRVAQLPEDVQQAFHTGTLNPWMINHSTSAPNYFLNTLDMNAIADRVVNLSDALLRLRRAADRVGAPVVAINIPEGFYVNREAYNNVQRIGFQVQPELLETEVPDQALAQAGEVAGISVLSVTKEFRARVDEPGLYLELDRHMTAKGNALLAEFIAPAVRDEVRALLKERD